MVFFNSLIVLALALQDIKNDRRYLTVDFSRVSIAQGDKSVVKEIFPHAKLSQFVVILICVINQGQCHKGIQVDSTFFPTHTEKLE
jgi:hypothetical protein